MPHEMPPHLSALLDAPEGQRRDDAWAAFVQRYSALLLHVSRSHGGDRDTVMDRYVFMLDRLRSEDFRRLRIWARERRSSLTTWLTVVAQRSSLDLYRHRYGRPRDDAGGDQDDRLARVRLANLVAEELRDGDFAAPAPVHGDAEAALRRGQLLERLHQSLAELSSADRLFLTLRFRDGHSAAEIARTTGAATPFHVYRRLGRLLSRLRESLHARGVDEAEP